MTLLLNRQNVAGLLPMGEAIETVQEAFRQLALGTVTMPQRTVIRIAQHHGVHLAMPAHIGGEAEALAVKVVTVYPDNPTQHKLPTIFGLLVLHDARTGAPLAVMDAGYLTAVRTGAVSGVATRFLARKNARTVGVFGAGVQAETQLMAVCAVRNIKAARVFDAEPSRARAFAEELSRRLDIEVLPVNQPREAVAGCDVVAVATSASQPVFDGSWLEAGQHVNAVGSHTPQARELDTAAVARSRVVADHVEACLAEAGDLIIPIREGAISRGHIRAGLGEVVAGLEPGRGSDQEITLFKSVGLALQDAAVASVVYRKALEARVGTEFTF
jgi:alanine dehydrogenase